MGYSKTVKHAVRFAGIAATITALLGAGITTSAYAADNQTAVVASSPDGVVLSGVITQLYDQHTDITAEQCANTSSKYKYLWNVPAGLYHTTSLDFTNGKQSIADGTYKYCFAKLPSDTPQKMGTITFKDGKVTQPSDVMTSVDEDGITVVKIPLQSKGSLKVAASTENGAISGTQFALFPKDTKIATLNNPNAYYANGEGNYYPTDLDRWTRFNKIDENRGAIFQNIPAGEYLLAPVASGKYADLPRIVAHVTMPEVGEPTVEGILPITEDTNYYGYRFDTRTNDNNYAGETAPTSETNAGSEWDLTKWYGYNLNDSTENPTEPDTPTTPATPDTPTDPDEPTDGDTTDTPTDTGIVTTENTFQTKFHGIINTHPTDKDSSVNLTMGLDNTVLKQFTTTEQVHMYGMPAGWSYTQTWVKANKPVTNMSDADAQLFAFTKGNTKRYLLYRLIAAPTQSTLADTIKNVSNMTPSTTTPTTPTDTTPATQPDTTGYADTEPAKQVTGTASSSQNQLANTGISLSVLIPTIFVLTGMSIGLAIAIRSRKQA